MMKTHCVSILVVNQHEGIVNTFNVNFENNILKIFIILNFFSK